MSRYQEAERDTDVLLDEIEAAVARLRAELERQRRKALRARLRVIRGGKA